MIYLITLTLIVFELIVPINTLIVEGVISTKEDWKFITRFCYLSKNGLVEYTFEYPSDYCCQDAILYYDIQWPSVYPQPEKSCTEKHKVADPKRNQILTLSIANAGSKCENKIDNDGKKSIVCSDYRKFSSGRPRWWYLVVSHCGFEKGLELKYKMIMTNGDTFWTKHFSADEQNILETDIFFCCIQLILLFFTLYIAYLLSKKQLFHSTFKVFLWAVFFELFSIIVNTIYYVDYGETGKPRKGIKNIGRGCHCISDTIFVVLLVLLGKGWTVTRARISPSGQIKLAVFCTLYSIAYVALFIYEAKAFDPGEVLYIYESPAGVGICIMKVVAWIWFCYGIYFTLKNYERKRLFYYPFFLFYTLWFLSGPILVLIATEVVEPHKREQIMNGVDRVVAFLAFAFFLMLTRPSSANKNFPYHVRTTQIGIAEDGSNQNFEGCTYKPSSESVHLQRNVSSLFAASSTPNGGSRSSETSGLCSGEDLSKTRSFINQTYSDAKESPPNYNQLVPPTAPPSYYMLEQPMLGGNFVSGQGNMLQQSQDGQPQQQQQQQQQQQLQQQRPGSTIVRSEQQITSLFKANSSLSPNPINREPSPSFVIPEPDIQFSPPPSAAPPASNGTISPPPHHHSPISMSASPPSASPTTLLSPNQSANREDKESPEKTSEERLSSSTFKNFTVDQKEVQTNTETTEKFIDNKPETNPEHDDSNDTNNNTPDVNSDGSQGKRKKKKKSRRSTLRKEDLDTISSAVPKAHLEPITGLNREKLPPLRSGPLPPLNK